MSLADSLAKIREGAAKRVPADQREIMARATRELEGSGIMEKVIQVGDTLPPFSLQNQDEQTVTSSDLLATGPLVLTVFRGSW